MGYVKSSYYIVGKGDENNNLAKMKCWVPEFFGKCVGICGLNSGAMRWKNHQLDINNNKLGERSGLVPPTRKSLNQVLASA